MRAIRSATVGAPAILLVVLACLAPAARAASPEGRWLLVEQRYEAGGANMIADGPPLHIEFTTEAGRLTARMWTGSDESVAVSWPSFSASAGPAAQEVRERVADPLTGEVRASYSVRSSPGDDLVLEVTETYRVSKDGASLEGTLRVKFAGGKENRGGYTLHRRFEREE